MIEKYGLNHYVTMKPAMDIANMTTDNNSNTIARIITDYGNGFKIATNNGIFKAFITGKLRYESDLYPVIGDFVEAVQVDSEKYMIHKVLDRTSTFSRKIAGSRFDEQVQGANFDYMFIVSSMNKDLNLRKLERYITTAWDTGATPVIILTKADLADDVGAIRRKVETIAIGVNIHCVSSLYDINIDELNQYLIAGQTIALFGSSGVGKSTLINTLSGTQSMKVNTIREDDARGRHTTTHRELILLPNGTILMDTPGMREVGLWDDGSGIDQTFDDINVLSTLCKFRNCTHTKEPGCAIKEAIVNGELDAKRYDSYVKLKKEAAYVMRKAARKERAMKKG